MTLAVVNTIPSLRQAIADARRAGLYVGFVPTMGALHEGHASLIRAARRETDFVIVSIFVNPTQFGPDEHFSRYPRTYDADLALCEREKADLVFAPEATTIYPAGSSTIAEVPPLQEVLEGVARPGHFRGVATVVLKLFNLVTPDRAYFGQKDAQQVRIIQQMVRDLHLPVDVRVCPTVREADGLAISSRNRYLAPAERQNATCLFQALEAARLRIKKGERSAEAVRQAMLNRIAAVQGATLDYAEAVDFENLRPLDPLRGRILLAIAVRFGSIRLIDNILLDITQDQVATQ